MSDYFLGEVRVFSFAWAPADWALCDGAILPIQQNQALYSLYGIAFGGNGTTTFALPDLRGRVPVHRSLQQPAVFTQGKFAGEEAVTLQIANMPAHTHQATASTAKSTAITGAGNVLAVPQSSTGSATAPPIYGPSAGHTESLAADSISSNGAGASHTNMQPFAVVNFCVAMTGLYPSRP